MKDLADCRADLAFLKNHGRGAVASNGAPNLPEINRRLRDAAVAVQAADKLSSIEPGQPARIENSDYTELPVFVHFEPLTLKQIGTMLHSMSDSASRAKSIELSTPPGEENSNLWTADVTMAYLMYSPRASGAGTHE